MLEKIKNEIIKYKITEYHLLMIKGGYYDNFVNILEIFELSGCKLNTIDDVENKIIYIYENGMPIFNDLNLIKSNKL